MSGVSLAVGPEVTTREGRQRHEQPAMGGLMGSLRVIELQLVAFIMVFSASGLVPLLDLLFPVFSSVYFVFLSQFAFPSKKSLVSREIFQGSGLFRFSVVLGTTVGLFLPLAYVLGGFARGDDQAVRSAAPHLFLLSCQILTENVISGLSLFSPPIRAMVPLLYTVRRLFVILDWVSGVWMKKTLPLSAEFRDIGWYWFGKVLAVANLVYFAVNLFAFLIPCFLPRAFEMYFGEREEIHSKMAEDKPSLGSKGKKAK